MSCADVCIDMDYDGGNEFYAEAVVKKSRKVHRCCECHEAIQAGASYVRSTGKSDGGVFSEATCCPCHEIRKAFCCSGWIFGELETSMREQVFEVWQKLGPYDCLAKLESLEARNRAMAWFREWRDDHDLAVHAGAR